MTIAFDPDKDLANIAKHGVTLARAGDMEIAAVRIDERHDYGETRYLAFGLIDGVPHCLVFADRDGVVRAISLRRAHEKEYRRMSDNRLDDPENPEWTAQDFAGSKGPESLPPHILGAFPKTAAKIGRPPKEAPKVPITIRLDADIVAHFKAMGRGWQSRINTLLAEDIAKGRG